MQSSSWSSQIYLVINFHIDRPVILILSLEIFIRTEIKNKHAANQAKQLITFHISFIKYPNLLLLSKCKLSVNKSKKTTHDHTGSRANIHYSMEFGYCRMHITSQYMIDLSLLNQRMELVYNRYGLLHLLRRLDIVYPST